MKSAWSERDAQVIVDRYAHEGIGPDLALRIYSTRLLGCEPAEYPLRSGLEQSYRALARLAPDQGRRIELVDQANEVRPRTWL